MKPFACNAFEWLLPFLLCLTANLDTYAAASFVAYSRVQSDEHWLRDVLAGAAIGIGSTYPFHVALQEMER